MVQVRQIVLIASCIYAIVVASPLALLITASFLLCELSLQDDLVEVELV